MSYPRLDPALEIKRLRYREVSVTDRFVRFTRRGQRELLPPRPSVESTNTDQQVASGISHAQHVLPESMPGFQAINSSDQSHKIAAPLPEDNQSSEDEEELPDPRTFVKRRAEPSLQHPPAPEEPSDICDRNWPFEAVIGERVVDNKLEYQIKWEPSTLLEKDIRRRRGCHGYVRCAGNDFNIVNDSSTDPSQDCRPQRLVIWQSTWRWLKDLTKDHNENMWEAIEEYHIRKRQENQGLHHSDGMFRPECDVNYSDYVRTRIREKCDYDGVRMKPKQSSLVDTTPRRALLFREGKEISFIKEEKVDAMLIYDTGVEQPAPCDRCQKNLGPFPVCVVDDRYNNGACASCVYARSGPSCNFSKTCQFSEQRFEKPANEHTDKTSGQRRRIPLTRPSTQEPESDSEALPTPMASTTANSSEPGSPVQAGHQSDYTNPTSPLGASPIYNANTHSRPPSVELALLPSLVQLQQRVDEAALDHSDEDWDHIEELAVLVPLSGSEQNERFANCDARAHHEGAGIPSPTKDRSASVCSEERKRKRKSTPLMAKPSFSLVAELPVVGHIAFRHDSCIGCTSCIDLGIGYSTSSNCPGPSEHPDMVYRQARFSGEEATTAQIRFILGRCPCPYTAYFQDAWEDYCTEMTKKGKKIKRTKESHLSKRFSRQINGVINEFCPDEPQAKGTAECPISIDD